MKHPHPHPHEVAQRPRMTGGLRLVPLALLMVCVLAASVVGFLTPSKPARTPAQLPVAAPVPPKCPPAGITERTKEPWLDAKLKAKTEASFLAALTPEVEDHPGYVRGRNGWLFFTDYQSSDFSQAIGRSTLTKKQITAWAKYFKKLQRQAESRGSEFFISVAPAKWDVNPSKLPGWVQPMRGTVSLDLLMKAHPELPWIDTRVPLRKASVKKPTYEPLDSHWTPYGGYVAWKSIATCLRQVKGLKHAGVPAISGVTKVADSNEFVPDGVTSTSKRRTVPVYKKPHIPYTVTRIDTGAPVALLPDESVNMLDLPARTDSTGAQTKKSLLVLRDSTGSSLSPLWSETFKTTYQYMHPITCTVTKNCSTFPSMNLGALVAQHKPTVTLFVMTERYLVIGPPK